MGDKKLDKVKGKYGDWPTKWSELMMDNAKRVCHSCHLLFKNKSMMKKHYVAKNECAPPQGAPRSMIEEKKRKMEKRLKSKANAKRCRRRR